MRAFISFRAMLALGIAVAVAVIVGHADLAVAAMVEAGRDPFIAMSIMAAVPRGIVMSPRVEADAQTIFNDLRIAVEQMRDEHKAELAAIKRGMGDVVQTEKVDRINAEITRLQSALDETNRMLAAVRVGGTAVNADPECAAHAAAFDRYFRTGADAGLRDLEVKAALRTDAEQDAGYLVDSTTEQAIDRVLGVVSTIRSLASVMSVSTQTYRKLVNQGGATGGWVGEREARTETNTPTLAALEFPAMEVYANPSATQNALDDARIDLAAWLADEVSTTFAEMEGAAFYSGNGVNKPRGLASYTMIADASYAWGKVGFKVTGVANALNDGSNNGIDGLLGLVYALKQGYRKNATFLMNRTTQGLVRKLKDSEGRYHWQPPVTAGQPSSLLGYPVADDDNVADVGSAAFPVWFGDFRRAYLIVDRAGIRVLRDPFTNKPYVMFYTTKRVGGGIQNFEAVKALKCST